MLPNFESYDSNMVTVDLPADIVAAMLVALHDKNAELERDIRILRGDLDRTLLAEIEAPEFKIPTFKKKAYFLTPKGRQGRALSGTMSHFPKQVRTSISEIVKTHGVRTATRYALMYKADPTTYPWGEIK